MTPLSTMLMLAAPAFLVAVGCTGSPAPSAVGAGERSAGPPAGSAGPAASPSPSPVSPPAWALAPAEVLECAGSPQPIGAVIGVGSPTIYDARDPETALLTWMTDVARDTFILPLDGYTEVASAENWVLFGHESGGRIKAIALAADAGEVPIQGRWTVTQFAACDPSEFAPGVPLSLGATLWTDEDGQPFPITRVVEQAVCGEARLVIVEGQAFVRDPEGAAFNESRLQTSFESDVSLPASAQATPYRQGDRRMYVAADRSAAFISEGNVVERWPRVRKDQYVPPDC